MSSWLAKVSDIAGRAEDLLNQIDQNAAVVWFLRFLVKAALKNTKKGAGKSSSGRSLADIDGQEIKKFERPQSEIAEAAANHHIRTDIYSASVRIRSKKKDDDLIAYLNNSIEPTSSRCSSVASCFSAPNPQVTTSNAIGTEPELYTAEEDLKIQHSDAVKCLHIKESQIAVLCVRLQEAEEANIKKDAQIAELSNELKLIKKELEARCESILENDQPSLKKLQGDYVREKAEFEKREHDYVKRLESANNENSTSKRELQELKTKILKMEIRLAKYNLEANKHEFDEYKQRSQKILSAKENLLTSLKENSSNGTNGVKNSVEVEELRCELGLLKDDLQQSQFVIYNLKADIQEMENKLRDEQRAFGTQRENLLKQMHQQLAETNQYREQMERAQLVDFVEFGFLQAEMRRQEEAVERKLAEKDTEITKLMEEKKTNKRYEVSEMDQKISLLSEKLITKQTVIEKLESEKRALELRLEHAEYACRNAETAAVKTVAIEMHESAANGNGQNFSLYTVSHLDNLLIRTGKLAVSIVDHLGFRLAMFMRSPVFRFLFLMYCILLHAWQRLYNTHTFGKMASVLQVPQSLRSIAHYVKIGAENANRDPIVNYWCFFYAVQIGMNIDKKSPEALQYLTSLLSMLEDMKKKLGKQEALTQDLIAQAHIENFAMKLFDYADKNDRQSNFTKGVIRAFYTAGYLIDVLTLFGELDENLIATRKYAKWKATYIHSCIKNGNTPKPGSAGGQDDDIKDINMRIPNPAADMEKRPASTTDCSTPSCVLPSGPSEQHISPVEPPEKSFSRKFSGSLLTIETSEVSGVPEVNRPSQQKSVNSSSGRLTLDDYMEAQKYAKYAITIKWQNMEEKKRTKTKREDYSPLENKERSKKTIAFGKKSKNKKKRIAVKELPVSSPFAGEHGIFAVPLSLAVLRMGSHDGIPLPVVVRQCIDCINEKGLCVEGIHRISAPKANLDRLEEAVNSRHPIQLEDIHDASGLLKRFLRQLPENILTNEKRPVFERIAANCPCGTLSPCRCLVADMLKAQLTSLPGENYMLLAYVFIHAQMILQNSDKNKMGMAALGLILQATLNVSQPLVRIFLLNASDVILMKYHSPSVNGVSI
uniref:Rho-GAP domain-containing protein n=1 Tax=Setaria digitata TaxID=48799 RepID=A0A915PZN8_9BILA